MKLTITEDPSIDEISVAIHCSRIDIRMERIVALLRTFDKKIIGTLDNTTYLINLEDIFYIEAVDKKTFFYTESLVYESALRLYELEERFEDSEFIRISKQMIVNFSKVHAIKPDFNSKLQLILSNHETVLASRNYAPLIKRKIGMF